MGTSPHFIPSTRRIQPRDPLIEEIDNLKKTLLDTDSDNTKSNAGISEYTQRIQNALPPSSEIGLCPSPFKVLLDIRPLQRTKIPFDILELLLSAGFDVNDASGGEGTPLHIAVYTEQYGVIKWLVEHGADCNASYLGDTPITRLAVYPDVLLELFDLLKTPENLNGDYYLSLHEAVSATHTKSALHLIQLGAEIDKIDVYRGLSPLACYVDSYTELYEEELFLKLIPADSKDIWNSLCRIFKERKHQYEVMSKMVHNLLQRFNNPSHVCLNLDCIDHQRFCFPVYMISLLVLLLDLQVFKVPDIAMLKRFATSSKAVYDIWQAYLH